MRSTAPPPPAYEVLAGPEPPRRTCGPYALHERIAVGGMAEVFRATPVDGGIAVALKRMLPALAEEPGARAMFGEERRIGTRIEHPNVVAVLDDGADAGTPFLVLELVIGLDLFRLSRFLRAGSRALGPVLSVHIARETLAGIHAVHEVVGFDGTPLLVVHRDVSPSNVLLSIDGDVKLADLGIAAPRGRAVHARAKGKLGYLAPEQVQGEKLDRRADVFAAGVVLAEMLIGRPLFSGGSELAILLAIRDGDLRALEEHGAGLDAGLMEVVRKALARDREERWASAKEFCEALGPYAAPEPAARRELAELVRTGLASVRAEQLPTPDGATPVADIPTDAAERTPTTQDMPALEYVVTAAAGKLLGTFTYARVVELIATAQIAAEDRVRMDGGPPVRISDIPQLSRHLPAVSIDAITRNQDEPRAPDLVLDLAHGGVVRAVALTILRQETGLLLCEQGGVRKEVYFRRGQPEFVSSNLASELLGEFLVARSVISRGELDMALAVLSRFEGRLGDTLAALGLVPPVELFRHIAAQVREKLLELFLWSGGRGSFYSGTEPPPSRFPLDLEGWSIVDEGVSRRIAHGLEEAMLDGHDDDAVARVDPAPSDVPASRLPGAALRLLASVTAGTTVQSLAREGKLPLMVTLAHLDVVRIGG